MRKSRRLLLITTAIAIVLASMPLIAMALSGAWYDSKVGPDLLYNNVEYCIDFNPTGQYVPANATITRVAWQWDVFPNNPVTVTIKNTQSPITTYTTLGKIGNTTAFNGLLANQTFKMCFTKTGGGATYGKGYDSLTVSWQTP